MSRKLRDFGFDGDENAGSFAAMAARKMTDVQHRELLEMLAQIDRRREALANDESQPQRERRKYDRLERLAKAAGHGVSTWHAWRRKENPTSPKFFDLRDFARTVGLDVRLTGQDVAQSNLPAGATLKPETAEVVKWMEGLPEEARVAVKEAALARLLELAARPPEAVAATEKGSRARSR